MANRKVVDLPELITMSNDDELYIVDISDLTESSEGTSKKIKASNFVPAGGESISNKQNSLTVDGTGVKYPTVDAVNNLDTNLVHKTGNETIDGDKTFNDALGTNSDLTIYGADLVFDAGANTLAVGTGILTANRTVNFKDESGTVALISDIVGLQPNSAKITTTVSITNATLTVAGDVQEGKIVKIDNGVNVINYTVNGALNASFIKMGTGAITFVQGSGRTLTGANGTLVLNGAVNSTASIVSDGTVDLVYINNLS